MNNATLGFVRGIGTVILFAVLTYLGNAANLNGVVSAGTATFVAGLALMLEHVIETKTGSALFGAVRRK